MQRLRTGNTLSETSTTPPPKTTRKERARLTRERVLNVAMLEFASRTFQEVQISEIAEKAEVAHGLIFHYFSNKHGLYIESVKAISRLLFDIPEPDPALKPYYRIRANQTSLFIRMINNEELFLGYVRNSMALESDPEAGKILDEVGETLEYRICKMCGIEDASRLLIGMLAIIHTPVDHLVAQWLEQERPYPLETLVETSIHFLLAAFRAAHTIDPSFDINAVERALTEKP